MFLLSYKPIISLDPKKLIDHPLSIELFEDLPFDEYNALKNDIEQRGIQDALHVIKRGEEFIVVSGHQRKKIALELKIEIPCILRDDLKEDWQVEEQLIMDNLLRRHLTDYQKGEVGKRLEPIEKEKAKQRQISTLKKGDKSPEVEMLPQRDKGKSRDKIAEKLGISGKQYEKIKTIRDKASKKVKKDWKQGKISTHQAYSLTTKKGKGMSNHSRKIIFSSKNDDWATPDDIYKKLDDEFHFDFDPCPLDPTFNGLEISWKKRNFINPPYSNIDSFLEKGHHELNNGHTELLVYLIPVRTDTRWFHKYIYPYFKKDQCEIRFQKGRIKFSNGTGAKHSAPFPSMYVIFDRRKNELTR